jgi:hypothetical protein
VFFSYLEGARRDTAGIGVRNIEQAVEGFNMRYGDYPPDLLTLTQPIENKPAVLEEHALLDPWGRPYNYEPDNRHPLTGKPLVYSHGPTPGDPNSRITNW